MTQVPWEGSGGSDHEMMTEEYYFRFRSPELRRRIELIQDFSMPTASTDIQVTPDGQYILATGQMCVCLCMYVCARVYARVYACVCMHACMCLCACVCTVPHPTRWQCSEKCFSAAGVYKPRVRCYDVTQLSMKFERCVDSEGMSTPCMCGTCAVRCKVLGGWVREECLHGAVCCVSGGSGHLCSCLPSSVVRFNILSDDYSKVLILCLVLMATPVSNPGVP